MRRITFCLFAICAITITKVDLLAQSGFGTYHHQTYTPKSYKSDEYSSSPQNWGIAQDERGVMFFCNTSGILEYDGIDWTMVPGTENLELLKVVKGSDGKIYAGGRDEFGFIG